MTAEVEVEATPAAARGTAILALANLVILGAVALSAPLLARLLGPAGRGELAAAFSLFMILRFIAPLGLLEASTRALSWDRGRTVSQVGRASVPMAATFGIVLAVGTWVVAPLLFPGEPDAVLAVRALAVLLPVFAVADVFRGLMVAERAYLAAACLLVSPWLGRLVAAGVMFVADDSRLGVIAFFSAAGIVPGLILALAIARPRFPASDGGPIGWHLRRRLLSFGSRATLGSAAAMADRRIDQVLMLPLAGAVDAGLYVIAVTVAELPDALTRSVRSVLLAERSKEPNTDAFVRAFRTTLIMVVLLAAAIAVVTPVVLPFVFGDGFAPAVPATMVLLVATLPLTVQALAGTGLYLADQPGRYGAIRLIGVVTNVALLTLLAPTYGAAGAALASLGAYSLTAVISLRALGAAFNLPYRQFLAFSGDDVARVVDPLRDVWATGTDLLRQVSVTPVLWAAGVVVTGLVGAALVVAAPGAALGLALAVVALGVLLGRNEATSGLVASLYLVLVLFPSVRGVPQEIGIGAFSVDAHLLLLPLLVWPALRARPLPAISRPVAFFTIVVGGMALWGVLSGAPLLAVVQDVRLPLMFIGGFLAGLVIIQQHGVARLAQLALMVTGATATLILIQLTTSLTVLEGRVRAATNITRNATDLTSATRFLVSSEDLALLVVVLSVFILALRRAPIVGVWGLGLLSGLVVLTQSLSRQLLVGLLIASFLSIFIRRGASRLVSVAVVGFIVVGLLAGVGALASDFGLVPGEESAIGRQVSAFEERVLGGFRSETLAGDQGIGWRSRENQFASDALSRQPLTGVGLGRPYRPEVRFEPFGSPTFFRRWVHNLYLSYGAKGGVVALGALLWVMLAPIVVAWRRARSRGLPDVGSSLAAVMLPAFAVMSLVDPVFLNSPTGAVTGCLLAVLALDATVPRGRDPMAAPERDLAGVSHG